MAKADLTQSRLRELLHYDPETGVFTRRITFGSRGCFKAGVVVGTKRPDGYTAVCVDYVQYLAHRLAWFYVHGEWPPDHTDHRNGIKSDNRIANLRPATWSENMQNQHKPSRNNKSGIRGVSWHVNDRRWRADIHINGKQYFLGNYLTKEGASAAYLAAKARLHPFSSIGSTQLERTK